MYILKSVRLKINSDYGRVLIQNRIGQVGPVSKFWPVQTSSGDAYCNADQDCDGSNEAGDACIMIIVGLMMVDY